MKMYVSLSFFPPFILYYLRRFKGVASAPRREYKLCISVFCEHLYYKPGESFRKVFNFHIKCTLGEKSRR